MFGGHPRSHPTFDPRAICRIIARVLDDRCQSPATLLSDLRIAEYNSVREEWLTSRDGQQHTLQWTLAALAVLFAGILSSSLRTHQPFLFIALAAVAVAAAVFSEAIWFGEVLRMERAALYLRGLERALSGALEWPGKLPPLMWERWRAYPPKQQERLWIPKAVPSILGGFAIFGLLAAGGITILGYAAADHALPHGDRVFALVAAAVSTTMYLVVTTVLCKHAWFVRTVSDKPTSLDVFLAEASSLENPPAGNPGSTETAPDAK